MTPAVFVIATGKETEVICLMFEAKGLERDQLAILMFKLASIVTKQKAAGGWRNKNDIPTENRPLLSFPILQLYHL